MTAQIQNVYFYAIGAALCFSFASIFFTKYSSLVSPLWMNAVKGTVALFAFGVISLIIRWQSHSPLAIDLISVVAFLVSGAIGLGLGDVLLLKAYTDIGSARTLMIFSFQPVFIGIGSLLVFGQTISGEQGFAIVFLILCTLTISYEKFKQHGHWHIQGVLYAFLAVILDNSGVILTRYAFDHSPSVHALEGNFFRALGAVLFFAILRPNLFKFLKTGWKKIPAKEKWSPITISLVGTVLSLSLWLTAVQKGHLATLAGFGALPPLFATTFESIQHKRPPSSYLWVALGFFICGFLILMHS